MNKNVKLCLWIVFGILLLLAAAKVFFLVYFEHAETNRGTATYFLRMHSKTIKNFPVIKPVGAPIFSADIQEGPGPDIQEIRYKSTESETVLLAKISDYMAKQGYSRTDERNDSGNGPVYKKGIYKVEIVINNSWVSATELTLDW